MLKPKLIPILWLAAMLFLGWLALFKIPMINDITLFIPKTDKTAELLLDQLRSGPAARLILIGLEGDSAQARALVSRRLAEQLRSGDWFTRVLNGTEPLDRTEQRQLFSYRYLLSPTVTAARFTPAGLRESLQQRLRELSSPVSVLTKHLVPVDPTGEILTLARVWQGNNRPPRQCQGVWCSPDGRRALMLTETQASGFDPDRQKQVVTAIRQAFATAKDSTAVTLLLSGPGIFSVLSQDTIRHEAELLSVVASVLMVLIVWGAFRSLRPVLLSVLVLVSAVLVAVATGGLLFGGIFGITLAFGMTLLGEAVDYPILVFTHLRRQKTVKQSLQAIWPTLRLCAATTILGSSAMITTALPGLAQLGVVTIAGLLGAVVFTRWVLPTLFPPGWTPHRPPNLGAGLVWLLRPRPGLAVVLVLANILMLLITIAIAPPLWEDDLAAMSPIPEAALKLDQELRTALGAPETSHLIVITAADAETALKRSETVAAYLQSWVDDNRLGGFDLAVHYLPSQHTQRERQAILPPPEPLRANLDTAVAGLPFQAGLFEPFLAAVEAARTGPLLQPQDLSGTALGLRIGSLLFPSSQGWTALVLLKDVHDPDSLAKGLLQQGYEGVSYLDMKAATNRLVAKFRDEALLRMAGGVGLIGLVVWLGFKSWRLVLAALLPVALAINMDVVALLWLGERLSLFHLVSLLLVLGIGTNYGLFFSRPEADPIMRQRTLYGLLACCGSTITVFAMLSFSSLPVLKAIGQTVAIGVFSSLLLALVLSRLLADRLNWPASRNGSGVAH
ncbi:MAG: MMPL family transporter [Candidatus Competibacteraceae bacterium]